jgi:hypothetical protein
VLGSLMDATVSGVKDTVGTVPTYDETEGATNGYFMGLDTTARRWYDYQGGWVRVGTGIDPTGGLYMGVVHGPKDWFDGTEWKRIAESFETFQ